MELEPLNLLRPVSQQTLGAEAAEHLRSAIRNGTLPPGTRLVERELAMRLGVSRIPVREAIHQLVEEGLVVKIPHRGTFVYAPSIEELEEIASLRVVLERFVVERVIANWQPHHEAQLRGIVQEMRHAATDEDRRRVFELDTQFHHTLWEIAEHHILLEVVSSLRSRIGRFLYEATMALPPSELEAHVGGHEELLEAFKGADVMTTKDAITHHILAAEDRILTYCQDTLAPNGR
jgi:DNA-binding GntR family transcriptional regulator